MSFLNKVGSGFKKTSQKVSSEIREYKAKAPERRAKELQRLREETEVLKARGSYERERTRLRSLRQQSSPMQGFGASMGGSDMFGMIQEPASRPRKTRKKATKKKRTTAKRKKKR